MPRVQRNSDVTAVSGTSAQFSTTMIAGVQYVLRATTDIWFKLGSNPTAAANTDGNSFLARGQTALVALDGASTKVAVIQDSASGYATLDELAPSNG
jgi:hypothetical protein